MDRPNGRVTEGAWRRPAMHAMERNSARAFFLRPPLSDSAQGLTGLVTPLDVGLWPPHHWLNLSRVRVAGL